MIRRPSGAFVPEWLIRSTASDRAVRCYALLSAGVSTKKALAAALRVQPSTLSRVLRELRTLRALTLDDDPQGRLTGDLEVRDPGSAPSATSLPLASSTPDAVIADHYTGAAEFWAAYPRQEKKPRFARAWREAGLGTDAPRRTQVWAGLRAWQAYWTAAGTAAEFIPTPAVFVANAQYTDTPPVVQPALSSQSRALLAGTSDFLARRQEERHALPHA